MADTSFKDKLSAVTDRISALGIFQKSPSKKTIFIAFLALLIIIGAVSGVLVIDELRGGDETTIGSTQGSSATAVSTEVKEIEGNFLLVLGDSEKISLISLVGLDSSEKKVRVAFISPETVCLAGNKTASMLGHYQDGGITRLREAVGSFADIEIAKHIIGDEADFVSLVRNMGELPVVVEERVDSSHDGVSFIIDRGEQILIPDMMLKYFLYLCENQPRSYVKLANIMMLLGERLFSTEDDTVLEKNINSFIGGFDTDISALDFSEYKPAVKKLATKEVINGMIIQGEAYHLGETTLG